MQDFWTKKPAGTGPITGITTQRTSALGRRLQSSFISMTLKVWSLPPTRNMRGCDSFIKGPSCTCTITFAQHMSIRNSLFSPVRKYLRKQMALMQSDLVQQTETLCHRRQATQSQSLELRCVLGSRCHNQQCSSPSLLEAAPLHPGLSLFFLIRASAPARNHLSEQNARTHRGRTQALSS